MSANLGKDPLENQFDLNYDPSLQEKLLAPLRFDRRTLLVIPKHPSNTSIAITLIVFTALLDLTGVLGFNFRFTIRNNGELMLIHMIVQPLFMLYVAFILRYAISILGNNVSVIEVYRILGYAHVWTVVSWVVFVLLGLVTSISINLWWGLFLIFGLAYFTTIILSLTSAGSIGDILAALFVILLVLLVGIFLPLMLIGLSFV